MERSNRSKGDSARNRMVRCEHATGFETTSLRTSGMMICNSFVQSKGTKDLDAPAIGKILKVCDPAVGGEKSIFRRNRSGQPTALFGASNFSAERSGKRATPESFELAVAVPGGSALVSRPGDTFQC
jgi:hypothetical protein